MCVCVGGEGGSTFSKLMEMVGLKIFAGKGGLGKIGGFV